MHENISSGGDGINHGDKIVTNFDSYLLHFTLSKHRLISTPKAVRRFDCYEFGVFIYVFYLKVGILREIVQEGLCDSRCYYYHIIPNSENKKNYQFIDVILRDPPDYSYICRTYLLDGKASFDDMFCTHLV